MNHLHQLENDQIVDLSKIKSLLLTIDYADDKEKKRIIVKLHDRVIFNNGRDSSEGRQLIPEALEMIFESEVEARRVLKELQVAWNNYIDLKA